MVKRYNSDGCEHISGRYVSSDDYEALQKERDELSKWKDAAIHECMMIGGCLDESNPLGTIRDVIQYHANLVRSEEMPVVTRWQNGSFSGPKDVYLKAKERDELAAYVERMHKGIDQVWNAYSESRPKWWTELLQIMRHKPASSLAAHDAEVVRRAAYAVDWTVNEYGDADVICPDKTSEDANSAYAKVRDLHDYADSLECK